MVQSADGKISNSLLYLKLKVKQQNKIKATFHWKYNVGRYIHFCYTNVYSICSLKNKNLPVVESLQGGSGDMVEKHLL